VVAFARSELRTGIVCRRLSRPIRGGQEAPGTGSSAYSIELKDGPSGDFDRHHFPIQSELRRIAGHFMKNERAGRTIQTTALVHEAYLKLIEVNNVDWQRRAHFFAVSAQVMRHILLDAARKRGTAKRGGAKPRVNLDKVPDVSPARGRELIALDDALNDLAKIDPRKAHVIELRFFGGLSVEETAAVLKVSLDTVLRDWRLARAWLLAELSGAR
jgi:RNA polymerase sigma-70 factor, ECF subfamily